MPIRRIGVIALVLVLVSSFFGYNTGYAGGKTAGYDAGYSAGKEAGYTSGQAVGYSLGKVDGLAEGYTLGYNVGYPTGKIDGLAEGYSFGKAETTEALTFRIGKDMLVKPRASAGVDCDDSALYMYEYFTSLGYEVRIVKGNLDMENETWFQCNHVWVWVKSEGSEYPYDFGYYCDDEQHGHGYPISYKDLLAAASADY